LFAVALAAVALLLVPVVPAQASGAKPHVLVFTKAADPKQEHTATSTDVNLLQMFGRRYGFEVDATDSAASFTRPTLDKYDVVLWLNNYGDVLDAKQQRAFAAWMSRGGGYVGVHGASRAERHWKYYHDLVGAFEVTGEGQPTTARTVAVDTDQSPARYAPEQLEDHDDQWYHFDRDVAKRKGFDVLATIDGGLNDSTLPVAWCHKFEGGRAWYTSMGHSSKNFEDGDFEKLLRSGIWWAAGIKSQPMVNVSDSTPSWPYGLTFLAWIAAVAAGGALAVVRLNRRERLA
jgi:type 1 glutamine amidotransferase